MAQAGDGLGLAHEPLLIIAFTGQLGRQNFDRDIFFAACLASPIHRAHTARAQKVIQFVLADFFARKVDADHRTRPHPDSITQEADVIKSFPL